MSWNAKQYCLVGIGAEIDSLEVIDSEAVYEDQNRYNPKTGKVIGKDKVTVKEKVSHYEWLGESGSDFDDLVEKLEEKFELELLVTEEDIYLGKRIGNLADFGNVEMLQDELEITHLINLVNEVRGILPEDQVKIHFVVVAG